MRKSGLVVNDTVFVNGGELPANPHWDRLRQAGGAFLSHPVSLRLNASLAQNASVTYGVSNTLGGRYEIWLSMIPGSMVNGVDPKPSSVHATITYSAIDEGTAGRLITNKQLEAITFDVDAYAVTRMKLATVDLGPCFYELLRDDEMLFTSDTQLDLIGKKYGVKVQLVNASHFVDSTADHNLYIDCIELIPYKD